MTGKLTVLLQQWIPLERDTSYVCTLLHLSSALLLSNFPLYLYLLSVNSKKSRKPFQRKKRKSETNPPLRVVAQGIDRHLCVLVCQIRTLSLKIQFKNCLLFSMTMRRTLYRVHQNLLLLLQAYLSHPTLVYLYKQGFCTWMHNKQLNEKPWQDIWTKVIIWLTL